MTRIVSITAHQYSHCLRARQFQDVFSIGSTQQRRSFSHRSPQLERNTTPDIDDVSSAPSPPSELNTKTTSAEPEQGAMSRRLQSATEDAIIEGGRAGRKAVEEAGFSEELRAKLLDRLQDTQFQSTYSASITEASLPAYASGRGARDIATAKPWTGTESTADAVNRMLNDEIGRAHV